MDTIVAFSEVSKKYNKELGAPVHTALANLSFSVRKGVTLGLIGANGAGKSTSIRLLLDLIRPNKGTIQLFNHSPRNARYRQKIGYLPEIANFPANLTVLDLLRFNSVTCAVPKDIMQE